LTYSKCARTTGAGTTLFSWQVKKRLEPIEALLVIGGTAMQELAGKVAVVTGAASGIGLGLATRFAQEGMKVVLADVEAPALDAAVRELRQAEHDVIGVETDVSDEASVAALARATVEAFGKVHLVCNNAGVGGGRGLIWEGTMKDWAWIFGVNFWGVVHGVRAFVPIMLAQNEPGHVVNTASAAGLLAASDRYGITKHAVVALSEALYYHLRMIQSPLHASVLCPGWVQTNILTSSRNRPAGLQNAEEAPLSEVEQMIQLGAEKMMSGGLLPEQVADVVIGAIREERFWITTTDEFDEPIRGRVEQLLERRNPELPSLG
jgi:NAD(P)-dependent dehydrogenase (short-subunit alcohol dehydrogenase family)